MIETPILIVGGGPVGLNLAIQLGTRGVPTMLVNEQPTTPDHPQGNSHGSRTMEHYRALGIADTVRRTGLPPDHVTDAAFVTRFTGYELARWPMASSAEKMRPGSPDQAQTPEPLHRASQMYVEAVLKQHADTLPSIDMRFGWRMTAFADRGDHVTATIEPADGGEPETVRCAWLVGCDGGHGMVRRQLGIGYTGRGASEVDYMMGSMLSHQIEAPAVYDVMTVGRAWFTQVFNADSRLGLVALDGKGLFLSHAKVAPGTDPATADPTPRLRAAIGANIPIRVISTKGWNAGLSLIADHYGAGRVLLAGDSVHLFTPTGGFGMNTGVDDAANLGWKLAAWHQGWAGPGLIASYETERRPVGIRNLAESYRFASTNAKSEAPPELEDATPEGEAARARLGESFLHGLDGEFSSIGIQLGARYDTSPLIVGDGEAPPADDPLVYTPTSVPGGRAPHVWLADGSSLYDRLSLGFTLLRLGSAAPDADNLIAAATARGVPLTVAEIADEDVRDAYQRDLALIRPDWHVAWRGNDLPDDPAELVDAVVGGAAP